MLFRSFLRGESEFGLDELHANRHAGRECEDVYEHDDEGHLRVPRAGVQLDDWTRFGVLEYGDGECEIGR